MLTGINTNSLSQIYRSQTNQYSKVLEQIASGQKFTRPSDDFTAYTQTRSMQSNIKDLQNENAQLVQGKESGAKAAAFGNAIFEGLTELKELLTAHGKAGDSEKATIAAEFDAKRNALAELASNNSGTVLKAGTFTGSALTTEEGKFNKLTLSGSGFGITALTGDSAALDDALTAAAGYSAKADAFNSTVDRQLTINENVMAAKENSISAVRDIDEVKTIQEATNLGIRRSASVAMFVQANISQGIMARLYS